MLISELMFRVAPGFLRVVTSRAIHRRCRGSLSATVPTLRWLPSLLLTIAFGSYRFGLSLAHRDRVKIHTGLDMKSRATDASAIDILDSPFAPPGAARVLESGMRHRFVGDSV